ncbi:MAG: nucleotidyltransferase family protein [Actinobacteria bacterium]|nr:nucleotidyltransferase family protein [Actinomycetota bacterium]MCA1721988.1 nucleotidyltransferase family protein [Actinomycetota bacterium]
MNVAGLLLAAGAGSRFGGPKALVSFEGELLVVRGQRLLREGGCDPVLVVLGAQAEQVAVHVDRSVLAADWETGMGASLRAGLAALEAEVDAVVVALADQPRIGSQSIERLRAAAAAGAVAAVATYAGKQRNPVLLTREIWDDVARLSTGDTGARPWLRAHPELVVDVPCDDTGTPHDIDTPHDLAALEALA